MLTSSENREHRRLIVGDLGFEVDGLIKRFGRTTAVDGVSLSAPHGQVLGPLGPNGAGKTTSRNPGPIRNGIVTPALFMILFLYLFGRSVAGSTAEYLQYLFPGILVMGAGLVGMISTGSTINLDLKNGVTDRFRSLPISRTAPLLGSVLADILRYLIAVAVLFGIGAPLGFRIQGSVLAALGRPDSPSCSGSA
jgi:hypothetical protein